MSYTTTIAIDLGPAYDGLQLKAQLRDTNGNPVGMPIASGFFMLGLPGVYEWTYTFDTGFRGGIDILNAANNAILASGTINPEDADSGIIEGLTELPDAIKTILDAANRYNALTSGPPPLPTPCPPGTATGEEGSSALEGDLVVIRPGIPALDGCPILTRLNAFIVPQGVPAFLEFTFRDRTGNPIDLSRHLTYPVSEQSAVSASMSQVPTAHSYVILRVKEWLGAGASHHNNPVFTLQGEGFNPAKGVVRCRLGTRVVALPGIYEMSWGILEPNGTPLVVNQAIMSVERSLFYLARDANLAAENLGPPTINEVRMWMMDSSPNENLLLADVEFKDEQILLALTEPVRYWNEIPPPIEIYTTRNFPYWGAWASGTLGRLHLMAANHYRRNRLAHSAGGTSVDDKNKEREYLAEGQRLWEEFKIWCQTKKVANNLRKFCGQSLSAYSSRSGW